MLNFLLKPKLVCLWSWPIFPAEFLPPPHQVKGIFWCLHLSQICCDCPELIECFHGLQTVSKSLSGYNIVVMCQLFILLYWCLRPAFPSRQTGNMSLPRTDSTRSSLCYVYTKCSRRRWAKGLFARSCSSITFSN